MPENLIPLTELVGIENSLTGTEIWKDLDNYAPGYRISSYGRILFKRFKVKYSTFGKKRKLLKARLLLPEGSPEYVRVDTLMFRAFAGLPNVAGHCVKYLDGDKENLRLENLALRKSWLAEVEKARSMPDASELKRRRMLAAAKWSQAERDEELRRALHIMPGGTPLYTGPELDDDHWYDLAWVVLGMNCPYLPSSHFRGGYRWCDWELEEDAFEHDYEY